MTDDMMKRALLPGEDLRGEAVGVWRTDDKSQHFGWLVDTTQGRIVFVNTEDFPAGIRTAPASGVELAALDEHIGELALADIRVKGNLVELESLIGRRDQPS